MALRFSGERLQQERTRRGWSPAKLARRAGVRDQQISRWESGQNNPSADAVGILAAALQIDLAELYEESRGDDDEEDESDMARIAGELERLGHADMAADLRARTRHVPRREKEPA